MTTSAAIRSELWFERRGDGPDVLLIAGLGDPAEAWAYQLGGLSDRYRVTAFDNRGVGRTALPDDPLTTATMADDAAALLHALGAARVHVAGFSMGSLIAQELALRHPELVRSLVLMSSYARPDARLRAQLELWRWLPTAAPDARAFYEAFFTWVYTPRAHADGTVATFVDEALAFAHPQTVVGFRAQLDACVAHDTHDRLARIAVPTLVLAGEHDAIVPPHLGRAVAAQIPHARFEVMPGEAHQPFQEVPERFNDRVDAFWRALDTGG
ncbi:MAG TPA: alpha/beta hydrolase [Solirubrobacteraceae bacterium]|nr:alpha/beta hydrolase [Solirubrobacteraceae bacterium]